MCVRVWWMRHTHTHTHTHENRQTDRTRPGQKDRKRKERWGKIKFSHSSSLLLVHFFLSVPIHPLSLLPSLPPSLPQRCGNRTSVARNPLPRDTEFLHSHSSILLFFFLFPSAGCLSCLKVSCGQFLQIPIKSLSLSLSLSFSLSLCRCPVQKISRLFSSLTWNLAPAFPPPPFFFLSLHNVLIFRF